MRVAFFLPVSEIRGGINDRIVNRISVLRAYGPVGGSRAAELLGKDPVLLAKVINDLQLELIHWRSAQTGMIENSLVRHQVWCAVLSFFQPKRDRFTRLSSLE
jgi:hypothetical protein